MRREYPADVLAGGLKPRREVPQLTADVGLVVEERESGFCGAVLRCDPDVVHLEDRRGAVRLFPLGHGFLVDGSPVCLVRPAPPALSSTLRSASGSTYVRDVRAKVAASSRIWVEGIHDAELVEKVWGHDLRVEGVAVEPLHGIDDLAAAVREFGPALDRRLGVLVDHLVPGSKESRIVAAVAASPHVLVVGHPYVDVWQAVRPSLAGLERWPDVPRGIPWKDGMCAALGWGDDTGQAWSRLLSRVRGYGDLEPSLLRSVEQLIDFVTDSDFVTASLPT
ncbi:MAG: hypothetical protein QOJ92_1130 [Frankiales bacterium]|nr:hypothetical protein [Frankiales bacterium]